MLLSRASTRQKSDLERIPGVGPSIAADLHGIGMTKVAQLRYADAQSLYDVVCKTTGKIHDRCLLYVFRCAVYYASNEIHEAQKLKWWYWKQADRSTDI